MNETQVGDRVYLLADATTDRGATLQRDTPGMVVGHTGGAAVVYFEEPDDYAVVAREQLRIKERR